MITDEELHALLADPAVWVEPDPMLGERIVISIAASDPTTPHAVAGTAGRSRRARYALAGVAAAIVLGMALAVGLWRSAPAGPSVEYSASLRGTVLAPNAHGRVTLTDTPSGWQIELRASGLERRDDGRFYEAWLKSRTGVLVPIGTFNDPNDVTLWAGVPPEGYPTITITRQSADGNQSSSGEVVLAGTAHRTD